MDLFQGLEFFSTLYFILLRHVYGISTSGYLLITNVCYNNTVSLTAAKTELTNMGGLECRRQCVTRESCKACHVFTHSVTKNQICHLYLNNLCDTNEVMMYQNSYVTDGSVWEKISGENINNTTTCKNEQNCVISTGFPPTAPISTSSTSETTISSIVQNTTSPTTILSTSTNTTISNTTSSIVQSTTTPTTTASTTGIPTTTGKPVEPRPRTCWDYYAYNGTLDVPGYGAPRPIWPTGFSNGTSITAYCRNGYTAIILNHPVVSGYFATYDNKNDVTVFGSTTQTLSITNTTGWNAYISSINFPILSALVRASNRTLYYEQQADVWPAVGIYSGLDITPDGTLTVQGSLQVVAGLYPSDGFSPPVINSSWVSGTCGSSFWKIPVTSTDVCNQATNLLLPAQYQKVGGTNRRYVGLAFR